MARLRGQSLTLTTSSGFQVLVEELDVGAVEANDHNEIPALNRLDVVAFGNALWPGRAEVKVDGAIGIWDGVLEAVPGWQELVRFWHRTVSDVVEGHGPEKLRRDAGRQMQLVGAASVEDAAFRVARGFTFVQIDSRQEGCLPTDSSL